MARGIDIELQAPQSVELPLHRESMASLIDNLVDNAVKYSPQNGKIMVSLVNEESGIRLTVSDEGPGIPEALREKAFERFYRIPDQEQDGSGLGLAIAGRAAVINHAVIHLDAGPGGTGLAAVVEFPRQETRAA
jgi:two-component system sensor histidine kinase QseC